MKDKLYIVDNDFSHAKTSSWYNESKLFEWERNHIEKSNYVVITDLRLVSSFKEKKVYGWIIEPPHIKPEQYSFAKENFQKFEKIFTYDVSLLNISDIFVFLPIGGCWIEEENRKIYSKNKFICSINSHKRITNLHNLRHEIIKKFPVIDSFGNGYKSIQYKIDVLKDYMFCVVIENQQMNSLFTEKIIDCFVTGTIPIYLGCPTIGNFFNLNGILQFDTIEELSIILENINSDFYYDKIEVIKDNFEKAKNYIMPDDFIYKKIKIWEGL